MATFGAAATSNTNPNKSDEESSTYSAQIKSALQSAFAKAKTKLDDIQTSKMGVSMNDIRDNVIERFLHLLNTGSEEELIELKGIGKTGMNKVIECRPITKVKDLEPEFSYKEFTDILMENLEYEMELEGKSKGF